MEAANRNRKSSPIVIWLAWAGGSFLAAACALGLTLVILRVSGVNEDRWMGRILVPALVILLGVAQALVLSLRLKRAGWWVGVTAAGCALTILIFMLISKLASMGLVNPFGMTTTLTLMIYGACTGVVQWVYLRRRWAQAIWWIPASIIGWALPGILVGPVFTNLNQMTWVGLVPAAVTGLLVAWWFSGDPGEKGIS